MRLSFSMINSKARPTGTACNLNVLVCFPETNKTIQVGLCADSQLYLDHLRHLINH